MTDLILTPEQLVLTAGILFLAGFANGFAGFGFGLTCMAGLSLFLELRVAVPIVTVLSLALSAAFAWKLRAHIQADVLRPLVGGALLGVPLGVLFLRGADGGSAKMLLGVVLLTFVAWSLRRPEPDVTASLAPARVSPWSAPVGFLGGALGGAFNTAGPPVIAFASTQAWSPDTTRATFQLFFAFTGVFTLIGHASTGLINGGTLLVDLIALPAPLLGMALGARVGRGLEARGFRRLLRAALFSMGVSFLLSP